MTTTLLVFGWLVAALPIAGCLGAVIRHSDRPPGQDPGGRAAVGPTRGPVPVDGDGPLREAVTWSA